MNDLRENQNENHCVIARSDKVLESPNEIVPLKTNSSPIHFIPVLQNKVDENGFTIENVLPSADQNDENISFNNAI